MKIVKFTVPHSNDSIVMEKDVLPFFYSHFHQHEEMQITLIIKGEGTLVIDNYRQRFKEGDIYFISANQPHIFLSDKSYFDDNKDGSVSAVHLYFKIENALFRDKSIPEMEQIIHFIKNVNYGMQVPAENSEEVKNKMQRIESTTGLSRLMNFIDLLDYLSINLKEYISLGTGTQQKYTHVTGDIRIDKIYQYSIEHYHQDISLDKIADLCHMTPQAFCKYFKKHTSKTYITFLQEIRINAACDIMIKGKYEGISSIAFATGFNSVIHFNKVFKKLLGITPGAYMKKYSASQISLESAG